MGRVEDAGSRLQLSHLTGWLEIDDPGIRAGGNGGRCTL
jgi:hypothetical protein